MRMPTNWTNLTHNHPSVMNYMLIPLQQSRFLLDPTSGEDVERGANGYSRRGGVPHRMRGRRVRVQVQHGTLLP